MGQIRWFPETCDCVLLYTKGNDKGTLVDDKGNEFEVSVDNPESRSNFTHEKKCEYHTALEAKGLHDEICAEQLSIHVCVKKLAELNPDLVRVNPDSGVAELDPNKAHVGLDADRNLLVAVEGLTDKERADLKTDLEPFCDKALNII